MAIGGMINGMDRECTSRQAAQFTKANGRTSTVTGKEGWNMQTEDYM